METCATGGVCCCQRLTPSKPNAVRRGAAAKTRPAKHVGTGCQPLLLEERQGDTGWKPVLRGNGERGGLKRSVYGRIVLFTSPHDTC